MNNSAKFEMMNIRSIPQILLLSVFLWFVIVAEAEETLGLICVYVVVTGISVLPNYSTITERAASLFLFGFAVIGGGVGIILLYPEKTVVSVMFVCIVAWLFLDRFVSACEKSSKSASHAADSEEYVQPTTVLSVRFALERATRPLTAEQISEIVGVSERRSSRSLGILSNDGVVIEDNGQYWLNSEQRGGQTWIPVGLVIAKRRIIRPFKNIRPFISVL